MNGVVLIYSTNVYFRTVSSLSSLIIYIVVNFSEKVETNFQKWTFLKMSKSEILEIVFFEENQFFSYAVVWFSHNIMLKHLFA
jgi:uncharacterized membrane protein